MPRRHDADEDDRPKARRRRDEEDDDEEERPKARRRRFEADDDDEDERPKARRRQYEDDDEPPPKKKKKKRPVQKELSVVGIVSLAIGTVAFLLSLIPCIGSIGLYAGILGLLIGAVALILASKSDGRQSMGFPIAGLCVSALAIIIAIGWMVLIDKVGNELERKGKEYEAEAAQEDAKRQAEVAKAAGEVKGAAPGSAMRVNAVQFFKAYDDDDTDQADRLYKNKVIEVTGIFHEVNFTGGEGYVVLLKGGNDEFETVDCNFAKDPAIRAQLSQLTPGATITIRGKCLGDTSTLEGCIIVP